MGFDYLPLGKSGILNAISWLLIAVCASAAPSILPYAFKQGGALLESYAGDITGANSAIYTVCEDEAGMVYASAANRLLIFDGSSWTHADISTTPLIRALAASEGRVWVGGVRDAGYFERNAAGVYAYTSIAGLLNTAIEGLVWSCFVLDDSVAFVTDRKVILYPKKGGESRVWELPNDSRLAAQKINSGLLVCQPGTPSSKLWLLRNHTLETVESIPTPLINRSFDFVVEQNGHWIFNTRYDIFDYDLNTRRVRPLYQDDGSIHKAVIASGTYLNGYIYLATVNSGLVIIDPQGAVVQASKSPGLSEHSEAVYLSAAGGVWVGHEKGVAFVHDMSVARIHLPSTSVRVMAASKEQLVVATGQDVQRLTRDELTSYPLSATSLATQETRVYASTFGSLHIKDESDSNFRKVFVPTTVSGGLRRLVLSRKHPNTVFTLFSRGIVKYDTNTGASSTLDFPDVPLNMVEDLEGNLWVSAMGGGIRLVDGELQKMTVKIPDRDLSFLAMHQGQPLPFIRHKGFIQSDGRTVDQTEALIDVATTTNPEGPAWIIGTTGDAVRAGVIAAKGDGLTWTRKNIPGLKGRREMPAVAAVEDHLLIALDHGVIDVNTSTLQDADLSVPPIESLRVRNVAAHSVHNASFQKEGARGLELEDGEREITVALKKKLWGLLEKPTYESRLAPLEDDWTPHAYGEPIVRKNLSAGHYTLQIRARHLGEVGQTKEFVFTRLPPWYASQLGITVLALGGVFLFFGAVKFRTRQIEQKNRQLEEKIRERTHELAQANAAKSEFLAAMSHEIRNPMNGVVGIVKMLQESNLGVREKYLLSTLHRCSEQLRTTVDDVLDFSKIEAGEITLHVDTFDLAETIRSTISAIDVTGERAELSSWAGSRPVVKGDQAKLAQILTNYLSNALKYGIPPRAAVDVFVLDEGDKRCRVTIAVKNSGLDIPPSDLAKLFERFQRGEFAKVRRIGGNGLGLSICKRYAEAMGGGVGVTSSGGITVFQVSIPFEKAEARQTATGALLPKNLNARALAIEDEDYNRLVLGNVLHKLGYKVDWAADGKSAIALAEQNGYDLILTDWMLPDMDGGELTQKLLAIAEEPKPPVFAVTAYSTKEKHDECLAAGMAGFISKPITLEKLEAALEGWGANRVPRPQFQGEEPVTPVSLEQISKLGPVELMVPEFATRLAQEWAKIEQLLGSDAPQAANAAHKLTSATLLVSAQYLTDQLRILEEQLRSAAAPAEVEKLREICREEIEKVTQSLRAAARRRGRLAEEHKE